MAHLHPLPLTNASWVTPPQVLHVGRELPVTVILKALLEKSFPEEYAARRQAGTLAFFFSMRILREQIG